MRRPSALQCLLYFRFQAAAYKLLDKIDHTPMLCIEKCVLRHWQTEAESSRTRRMCPRAALPEKGQWSTQATLFPPAVREG